MTRDLNRLPDWRARFAAEMDRQRRIPFEWGRHDCLLGLVCGAVAAITGEDIGAGFRGRYASEEEAAGVLREDHFPGLGEMMASLLPEQPAAFARVGDIGLVGAPGGIGAALGVIDASGVIVMTDRGHGRRPRENVLVAFKVG